MKALTKCTELDMKILAYLPDSDFCNICNSNIYLYSLSQDDYLWKLRFLHKYNLKNFKIIDNITFKTIYKQLYFILQEDGIKWAVDHNSLKIENTFLDIHKWLAYMVIYKQ